MHSTSEWAKPIHRVGTSGQVFVLVHGITGHPGHWLPLADHLAGLGHSVLAPLLAGHGATPQDLGASGPDEWIDSVISTFDDARALGRIHLVGLSMGGMISLVTARESGAATITTINAPVYLTDRLGYLAPLLHRFRPFVDVATEGVPDPELEHLWMPYPQYPTRAVAGLIRIMVRGRIAAGRLRRPALVIQSRADATVRPESGAKLAALLDAPLLWLDSARHNSILDPERSRIHAAVASMATR